MIKVVGGGLAGVEAAYQLAIRGHKVKLYEMRPTKMTEAHKTGNLAELVCSNSLKSNLVDTASGLLKEEMRRIGSIVLDSATHAEIPAGSALAVDKDILSQIIEEKIKLIDKIEIVIEEVTFIDLNEPTIVASGPLTSDNLSKAIANLTGSEHLYFYDAVAPVISYDSIDMTIAFMGARYNKGTNDYINCPMTKDEYLNFYNELINARCIEVKDLDKGAIFESCMPIEIMAQRGHDSIRFGPLKPVGIRHPETNDNYYAVVQLRKENKSGTMYNMVGFQTHLTFSEQKRVFSMIPGLRNAEIVRYGVMHRNTFINSPELLDNTFRFKKSNVYFAGQITGVEGYVESAMSGMMAGINMHRMLSGKSEIIPDENTIIGALSRHISSENKNFQPMNANFGIVPILNIRDKKEKKRKYAERSLQAMDRYIREVN